MRRRIEGEQDCVLSKPTNCKTSSRRNRTFSLAVGPDKFVLHRPHGIYGAQTVFYEAPDRRQAALAL